MGLGKRKNLSDDDTSGTFCEFCQPEVNSADRDEYVYDEQKVNKAVARVICETQTPFLFFKELVEVGKPEFCFSSVKLEHCCLDIYKEAKANIRQTLENLDGLISLSMDILRPDKYHVSHWYYMSKTPPTKSVVDFLCVRAHFIDDKWKPNSWVLYYGRLTESIENPTAKAVLKCLLDFQIECKLSTITPGDRYNYAEVIEIVKDQIKEKKKLQIKCHPFQIYCCADLFRQMVDAAFEEVDDIITKIRDIHVWPKSLPMRHITFSTLKGAIELQSKGEFSDFSNTTSDEEWEKARYACRLVEYIYNAAEILFMTKNPTATLYLHNLCELQASLRKESMSSDRLTLITHLLEKFDEYWKDMFLVLAIAAVMDPRCKMKYIEFSSLKYEGNSGESQITAVLEAIHGIYDDYKMQSLEGKNTISDTDSTHPDSDSEEELPKHTLERLQKCNFGFSCVDEYNEFLKPSNQPQKCDLQLYLDEPVLPWSQDFDLMN